MAAMAHRAERRQRRGQRSSQQAALLAWSANVARGDRHGAGDRGVGHADASDGKAMELLKGGLGPVVERELRSVYKDRTDAELGRFLGEDRLNSKKGVGEWDVAPLLKVMWRQWPL
jgi:hypothetical protein